jgi:nucleotide-binding universal stress UspA family protein
MANTNSRYKRILIAVDDTDCSKNALEHSRYIVANEKAAVALIHVTENPAATNFGVDPLMGQQAVIVPPTLQIQEESALKLLEEVKTSISDIASDISIFHRVGVPRQEILSLSIEWEADLIIMGTHGRRGIDHLISGSVSESVLRRATCPVLIIPGKC